MEYYINAELRKSADSVSYRRCYLYRVQTDSLSDAIRKAMAALQIEAHLLPQDIEDVAYYMPYGNEYIQVSYDTIASESTFAITVEPYVVDDKNPGTFIPTKIDTPSQTAFTEMWDIKDFSYVIFSNKSKTIETKSCVMFSGYTDMPEMITKIIGKTGSWIFHKISDRSFALVSLNNEQLLQCIVFQEEKRR